MVLYYTFCIFSWNFCIKLAPHQLTVILGLVSTMAIFWKLIPGKPVVTGGQRRTTAIVPWLFRMSTSVEKAEN